MRNTKSQGFSLLETCVAMSMLALFISVFVSLSTRLATAQNQQSTRAAALSHLEASLQELREQGPASWAGPWKQVVKEDGATYTIAIEEHTVSFAGPGEGIGALRGTVTWDTKTGRRTISREIWVHERLK